MPSPGSSAGQSSGLLNRRSQVRVLPGAFFWFIGVHVWGRATSPDSDNLESFQFYISKWRIRAILAHLGDVYQCQPKKCRSRWRRGAGLTALALLSAAATLSGCARGTHRVVDRSVPVSVRSGALVFDGPTMRKELEKQGYSADVMRWEYARNNNAVGVETQQREFEANLYRDSEFYGQPAPILPYLAPYGVWRGAILDRTIPVLSPARERWFNQPYVR